MSDLETEILDILNSASPSKALYRMDYWADKIRLRKMLDPNFGHHSSPISYIVESFIEERLDMHTFTNAIRKDERNITYIASKIRFEMRAQILQFLECCQLTKHNKGTKLYRWYHRFLFTDSIQNNEQFENDMFVMYKWLLKDRPTSKSVSIAQSMINVFEVLKNRYEDKGFKL